MPQISISDIFMTRPRLKKVNSIEAIIMFVSSYSSTVPVVHVTCLRTANPVIGSSILPGSRYFYFSINVNANHCDMYLYQIGLISYIFFYLKDNLPLFVLTHSRHKVMTISLMLGKNMISLNIQTVFLHSCLLGVVQI